MQKTFKIDPLNLGVVGLSCKKRDVIITSSPKEDPKCNEIVDIATNLPLLTVPVTEGK